MEGLLVLGAIVAVLIVLDVLAIRFGADSRRTDEGWSVRHNRGI
jgi:hypothetical protein